MNQQQLSRLLEKISESTGLKLGLVGALTGGTLARLYLLRAESRLLVLKLDSGVNACGSDWHHGEALQRRAASKGLAPEILHSDSTHRILLMEYGGNPLDSPPQPEQLDQAAALLSKLHRMPAESPGRSYRAMLETLCESAAKRDLKTPPVEWAWQILDRWDALPGCWCHHDLIPANLVWDGIRLRLIDWEYSGWGNPAFDLAAVIRHWKLDDNLKTRFLKAYGCSLTKEELDQAICVVQLFDQLWYALYQPAGDAP